ncbi:hypothetical protein ACWC2T_18970 [Streptomyces sp. NPDC001393]
MARLAGLRMCRRPDGERDREAVLADFVTALPPGDAQVPRALLDRSGTGLPDSTDTGEGRAED